MEYKYVRFDCDNVGDKIELCLYENDTQKAQCINNLVRRNIIELAENLNLKLFYEILLIGPDDILIRIPSDKFEIVLLEELKENFFSKTGISLSGGVGTNIIESMRNLDIAKRSGKNKIFEG